MLFLLGLVLGMLLVIAGIKTLVGMGRYLWKYAIGLLVAFLIGLVLMVQGVKADREYREYMEYTNAQTHTQP